MGAAGQQAVAELGKAFQEALDAQFALTSMPEIRPEHASGRVNSLLATVEATPLSAMVELRYYLAKSLISRDEAVAVLDQVLGAGQGAELLGGDEPRRRDLLAQWLSSADRLIPQR